MQVGGISEAAVGLQNHFVIINSHETKIMSEPQREVKTVKKCPADLQNVEGSEEEKKLLENLLIDFSRVF